MVAAPETDTFEDIWGGYQKPVFFYGFDSTLVLLALSIFIYPISAYVITHFEFVARHSGAVIGASPYSSSIADNLARTPLDAERRQAVLFATSVMFVLNVVNAAIHVGG